MNKEEFIAAWNDKNKGSGLSIIRFTGGAMFANNMQIITVRRQTGEKIDEHYEVMLSKNVGGIVVGIGSIRLDKIRSVI